MQLALSDLRSLFAFVSFIYLFYLIWWVFYLKWCENCAFSSMYSTSLCFHFLPLAQRIALINLFTLCCVFFSLSFLFGARVICSRMISAATVQPLIAVHLREQSTGLSCTYLNRTISCSVSQANSICLSRDSIEIIQ